MRFRPCIDIHNGKVKQIVGGSLKDAGDQATENFVSVQDASFYAKLYRDAGIRGGHVILLNSSDSPYYQATREQAFLALGTYPGGLQLGGGVCPENACEYLDAGASHVIVTSYVFKNGQISWENLEKMERTVGKERLVLDLSCRKKEDRYYIVTDRWQNFTEVPVTLETMQMLGDHCDEFLVHAVDVEGKARGIEIELAEILSKYQDRPVTYAGGVGSMEDLEILRRAGAGRLDVTIGSALDLFGGTIPFETCVLLSKLKSTPHIEVEVELDELELTRAESKATYAEIKQYVLENTGLKVSQLYIAQVKRKHGLIERINYNVGEGKARVPQVPEEKEKAIEDALRHFQMI